MANPYHKPAGSSEGGEFTFAPGEKVHALIPQVKKLPAKLLKPMNQLERNGTTFDQQASGLSPIEWAKTIDLSEPVQASLFSDGSLKLSDGHHRQYAGEILGKEIPVTLQAINAKPEDIKRLLKLQK